MKNYRLIILVLVVLVGWPSLMAESNIVITNADEVYTLVANGRGDLSKVKVRKETTYMAQRVAETAVALESFGSHVKIDKASAPGAKPVYKPWISEYVFYDDSKMCVLPVELKKGKPAKAVFEKGSKAYEQLGAKDKCALVVGNGGHRFYADDTWPLIHKMLGK